VLAAELHTIELDGRRFAWRSLGAGPPLVLLNGYAASAADWDPTLLDGLARSLTLICPDNRGIGESALGVAEELSVDAMSADVERLLDELSLTHAAVAGWSMGGYVAQHLALRAPGRVEKLVLLATGPAGSRATPADPAVIEVLFDHSGTPREQASRLISLLFPAGVAERVDEQFGALVAEARATLSPVTLAAQERVLGEWFSGEQPSPPADAPPVLVLGGELDEIAPPENSRTLARLWPDARLELFAGGGHAFIAQEPERVARLIASFARES
jgi:3-oxoadipate enol-lactonase